MKFLNPNDMKSIDFEILALKLVEINAIKFGAFKLKLHEKIPDAPLSPIYIDLRLLRSFPDVIDKATDLYIETLKGFEYDLIADLPTAATPITSIISYKLRKPMISIRLDKKTHGLSNQIDGFYKPEQKVVLIDDLITKADSKLEAISSLKENKLQVQGIVVLIDREQGGVKELSQIGYKCSCIFELRTLLNFYKENKKITNEQFNATIEYLNGYTD